MFLAQQSAAEGGLSDLVVSGIVVGIALLIYIGLTLLGRRWVRRARSKAADSGARAETLWMVLRRVLTIVIFIVTVLSLFSIWGLSLAPFLAVGTIVGAAIGFGAQTFVRDLIAGFFLLAEDQFHIGDTVTIANTTGTVEDVQMRVTVLRDLEGNRHFVPNGQIGVTSNYTSHYSQPVIDVPVAYSADIDLALNLMEDELQKLASDPEWSPKIRGRPEIMGIDKITRDTVTLRARITTVPADRWAVRREAYLRIRARFIADEI